MENLISKLKRIALCQPSGSLDERVLSTLRGASDSLPRRAAGVPLRAAVAAALIAAGAGFLAGLGLRIEPDAEQATPAREVRIVLGASSSGNPFDFSRPLEDHFGEAWQTRVVLKGEDTR